MHTRKLAARNRAKTVRSALTQGQVAAKSLAICERARQVIGSSSPVLLYASKVPEVSTASLMTALLTDGHEVVVPIIEKETITLRLSYLRDPSLLTASTFQVPEPIGNEIPAKASDIAIAVIPMLAFDRQGNRLGYGAGYYDRFLSTNPGITRIGLAFSCQEARDLPRDPYDVRMHFVVTEREVIDCQI